MRRLPKPRLIRAMIRKGMISRYDKEGIKLIEQRLAEHDTYWAANRLYHERRGNKIVDRFRSWMMWVWKHREAIMQVLGIIIMFADDGTPVVQDAREKPEDKKDEKTTKVVVETVHGVKDEVEVPKTTPDGEPVEDFVEDTDGEAREEGNEEVEAEGQVDEVPTLVTNESVVPRDYNIGSTSRLHELNEVQPDEQDRDSTD